MPEQLREYNILTRESGPPLKRIRLAGKGWYLDVSATEDGTGIEVMAGGSHWGSSKLIVRPLSGNVVRIQSDTSREETVHAEANRLAEVWKENEKADKKGRSRG